MPHPHEHGHADPDAGVFIPLRRMYQEIRHVSEQHLQTNAKLDTLIQIHTLEITALKNELGTLRQRLTEVEKRPTISPKGMSAVLTLVIAATAVIVAIINIIIT